MYQQQKTKMKKLPENAIKYEEDKKNQSRKTQNSPKQI